MTWLYKSFANIVKGLSFPSSSSWPRRYWFLYQNGFIRLPITPWFMARLCPCHECRHQTPATPSYSKDAQSYQLLLWVLSWIPSRYRKAWIWRILWCNEQGMGRDISTTTWYDRSNSSIECITRWTYFGSRRVWTTTCLEWSSRSCIESRAIKVVKWILVPQTNAKKSSSIFSFSFFHSLSLSFGSIQFSFTMGRITRMTLATLAIATLIVQQTMGAPQQACQGELIWEWYLDGSNSW